MPYCKKLWQAKCIGMTISNVEHFFWKVYFQVFESKLFLYSKFCLFALPNFGNRLIMYFPNLCKDPLKYSLEGN